jgi:hypothetical protein
VAFRSLGLAEGLSLTVRAARAAQCRVAALCLECDHVRDLDLRAFAASGHADTPLIRLPLQVAAMAGLQGSGDEAPTHRGELKMPEEWNAIRVQVERQRLSDWQRDLEEREAALQRGLLGARDTQRQLRVESLLRFAVAPGVQRRLGAPAARREIGHSLGEQRHITNFLGRARRISKPWAQRHSLGQATAVMMMA